MKGATSIQERLWELRKDKGLNLEELSKLTGISKSALGSYEKEDFKEINHGNLITLADFYGVSVDYLLCRTENREQINTPLTELHLNDEMVALLKSGRINNRLLCELATHKDFIKFLADIEIYVDGIATMQIVVIQQGALKGFVGIHPNWNGINAESIRSLCLSTYLPEEVMKLNDIAEMRAGATLGKALQSEYMTVSGACFINQSSPVMTISKNGIRFSKACHSRLDDCEYVELLYHPILQVVILRKSNHGFSTTMRWRDDNDVHSAFSARAFSGLVFQTLNWRRNCRYQCRGICRGQGNAKFLIFELDESRILTGKNQYKQAENCAMNLKCRLYRSKWVQSITVSDVMESGQVVENPMIGAIPSRNEVQRELDDLLMSM